MSTFDFPSNDEYSLLLASAFKREPFLRFCATEYSMENPVAYMCVGQYRAIPTFAKARKIVDLFFLGSSSRHEVNVARKDADPVCDALNLSGSSLVGGLPKTLFDELSKALKLNIADSFSRYRYTSIKSGTVISKQLARNKLLKKTKLTKSVVGHITSIDKHLHFNNTAHSMREQAVFAGTGYDQTIKDLASAGFNTVAMSMNK